MNLSTLFFTLFLGLFISFWSNAQWVSINGPHGNAVNKLTFYDGKGYAATASGLYIDHGDGSWQAHPSPLFYRRAIAAVDFEGDNMIAYSITMDESQLFVSTDRGESWTAVTLPQDVEISSAAIFDHRIYIVDKDFGSLYESPASNINWSFSDVNNRIGNVHQIKKSEGKLLAWNAGNSGYYSLEIGMNDWIRHDIGLSGFRTWDVFHFSDGYFAFNQENGRLAYSNNDGQSWNYSENNWGETAMVMAEHDGKFFANDYNILRRSSNYGRTWTTVRTLPDALTDLASWDGKLYFTSYDTGILLSEDEGVTLERYNQGLIGQAHDISMGDGHVYAAAGGGILEYNIDTGSWNEESLFGFWTRPPVIYSNNGVLYLAYENQLYASEDEGENWKLWLDFFTNPGASYHYSEFWSRGDTVFVTPAFTQNFSPLFTINQGANWNPVISPGSPHAKSFIARGDEWYKADLRDLYYSPDAGGSWELLLEVHDLSIDSWILDVAQAGDLLMIMLVPQSGEIEIWASYDNGQNWVNSSPVATSNNLLEQFNFLESKDSLYLLGTRGSIYASEDGGHSWADIKSNLHGIEIEDGLAADDRLFVSTRNYGMFYLHYGDIGFEGFHGIAFHDQNFNGERDTLEEGLFGYIIESEGGIGYSSTDNEGKFNLYGETLENRTIKIISDKPYINVVPTVHTIQEMDSTYSFAVQISEGFYDLQVYSEISPVIRPGFMFTYIISYINDGPTPAGGTIYSVLPEGIEYMDSEPPAHYQRGDTLFWEIEDLEPQQRGMIEVTLRADETVFSIGDVVPLNSNFRISEGREDYDLTNNGSYLRVEVVGSFDPNDKQVDVGEKFTTDQLDAGEKLKYTIRFQNTGNYPAVNVRITDQLDSILDPATFEILLASHDYSWKMSERGFIEFYFDEIWLADSVNNEPESHGFIKYAIAPKEDVELGDLIENKADIYFDFNEPVRTNTVATEIRLPLFTYDQRELGTITIYPNPASDRMRLRLESDRLRQATVEFYDLHGRLQLSREIYAGDSDISVQSLPTGTYVVLLKGGKREIAQGKVQVLR